MKKKILAWLLCAVMLAMMLPAPVALADSANPTMTFTTSLTGGSNITLSLQAANAGDLAEVWVDLNNNAIKDASEDTVGMYKTYTVNSQTITVYGKVTLLNCQTSALTSLDVSENPYLLSLTCNSNALTTLDVSQNTALTALSCRSNQMSKLDTSSNTALASLDVYDNELTALDVSSNTALTTLNLSDNGVTALDVSHNAALKTLNCSNNMVSSLNLSVNTQLTNIQCAGCGLSALDVSAQTALTELNCRNNALTSLNLASNMALINLYCTNNTLTVLTLPQSGTVKRVECENNQLAALDVSHLTAMTVLNCAVNRITALDMSQNTALMQLKAYSNRLKGTTMTGLMNGLRTASASYKLYIIDTAASPADGNIALVSDVSIAAGKNWNVLDWNGGYEQAYPGSEEAQPTTFVLSNEEGGLIDQLIAGGYGNSSLYEGLVALEPASGGVISESFLDILAENPGGSAIFTQTLNSYAGLNGGVAINTDGTVFTTTSIKGRDYYGDTGYSTYPSGAAREVFTYADSVAYYIDAPNGSTTYKVFAIGWSAALFAVKTSDIIDLTATGALVWGEATGDGGVEITERGVVYATTSSPTLSTGTAVPAAAAGIGEFNAALTGLSPNTTYYVRAYATNAGGTAYGAGRSFQTPVSITTVAVGSMPKQAAVNRVTNKIYVPNNLGYSVTVIDGATDAILTTIALGAGTGPYFAAVNETTNKIYIANNFNNSISVIDGTTDTVTATVPVGSGPRAIAINETTNTVYVANYMGSTVTVINGADNTVSATWDIGAGTRPTHLAVNEKTNNLYTANYWNNTISVIDCATGTVDVVIPASADQNSPRFVAVNEQTNKIYVANFRSANVTVIDGTNNSYTHVTVGVDPWEIVVNEITNKIYISTDGETTVSVLDGATNTVQTTIAGKAPQAVGINTMTNMIYVGNYNHDDRSDAGFVVTQIHGTTLESVGFADASNPSFITVNDLTNKVYVVNFNQTVTIIALAQDPALTVAGTAADDTAILQIDNKTPSARDKTWEISVTSGTVKAGVAKADVTLSGLPAGLDYTAAKGTGNTIIITLTGAATTALTADATVTATIKGSAVTEADAQDSAGISLKLWYIGEATTIVLTNEGGGYLIDKLIAAGHEDDSLYEVLELLQPDFSGVITDRFMKTLASNPADSEIFTEELFNFSVNYPVGINADGTVRINPIYGRDYHGNEGYTTTGSTMDGVGIVWATVPDSPAYYIDAADIEGGGGHYYAFAILWMSDTLTVAGTAADDTAILQIDNKTPSARDKTWEISVTSGTVKAGLAASDVTLSGLPAGLDYTAAKGTGNTIVITLTGAATTALTADATVTAVIEGSAVTEADAQDSAGISLKLWYVGAGTTFVISNELGTANEGGLIDKLIAEGHGDDTLYEVMQLLQPDFSSVITDRFMKTLASNPENSEIFDADAFLGNFAGLNNPVGVNADGKLVITSIFGRDYYGDTGYTTSQSSLSGVGSVGVTAADSAGYFIDTGERVLGSDPVRNYKVFAILWMPELPAVTTDAVESSGVTQNSADVSGSVTSAGTASVTERGFVYGATANPTTSDTKVTASLGTGTGDFSATLTSLAAATTYHVRAYAISGAGTAYGADVSFTTLSGGGGGTDDDPPTVVTNAVTGITASAATLNGNVTASGGASVTERGFVYGASTNPTTSDTKVTAALGTGTGAFSATLSGLTAASTYHVRAYAISDAGTSYGQDRSFTTASSSGGGGGGSTPKLPAVATGTASSLSAHTAVLNGQITSRDGAAITGYGFSYKTSEGEWTQAQVGADDLLGSFRYNLSGLTPGTEYSFKAWATNSKGTAYGTERSFKTPQEKEETQTDRVEPSDLTGHWSYNCTLALFEHGIITGYPDGSISPDQEITRAEAAVLLVSTLGLQDYQPQSQTKPYLDELPSWAGKAILTATEEKLMKGYPGGTFLPGQKITRAEMCVALVNAFPMNAPDGFELEFSDAADIPDWARASIEAALANNVVSGYPDKSFQPTGNIKRGEAFSMICRLKGFHQDHNA